MNKFIYVFLIIAGFLSTISHAKVEYISPKNAVLQIQREKVEQEIKNQQTKSNLILDLPNGKSINLNEWHLVVFMQSTCQYCQEFDPKIKEAADEINLETFVFSFDGIGDSTFKKVYPVNDQIVAAFFRDLPVATPTTFIVNVNDLTTAPVSQGSMKKEAFKTQLINTFIKLDSEK